MRTSCVLVVLCLSACAGRAEPEPAHGGASHPKGLQLSPELRAVLIEEMHALQRAFPELKAATAQGDLARAAELGDAMAGTFILKQKLTRQQHHELHHSVPKAFLHMDHRFHDRAGELADAARAGDAAAVQQHVAALEVACTTCHTKFR